MKENILIDSDFENAKGKYTFYTVGVKILMLAGLFYGAYIFFMYFRIKQELFKNPLLPTYTVFYEYGFPALKGGLLLISLSIAQVLILFRRYNIAFYLLVLAYAFLMTGLHLFLIPLV